MKEKYIMLKTAAKVLACAGLVSVVSGCAGLTEFLQGPDQTYPSNWNSGYWQRTSIGLDSQARDPTLSPSQRRGSAAGADAARYLSTY